MKSMKIKKNCLLMLSLIIFIAGGTFVMVRNAEACSCAKGSFCLGAGCMTSWATTGTACSQNGNNHICTIDSVSAASHSVCLIASTGATPCKGPASCVDPAFTGYKYCKEDACDIYVSGADVSHTASDLSTDGDSCWVYPDTFLSCGAPSSASKWDWSEVQCVKCQAGTHKETSVCGDQTGTYWNGVACTKAGDAKFESGCGADAACDEKYETDACSPPAGGACNGNGVCVLAAVCVVDGTCDTVSGETTANCPADCCDKLCGGGCTNAADCATIEPDCAGVCVDATCATDTDCGYWACLGPVYMTEDCVSGVILDCMGDLDGTGCGGGNVWSCSGACNPVCDTNFNPGGCPPIVPAIPACLDKYDACDCSCVASAGCVPDGCNNNCPAGCGGGDDPDCAGACADPSCAWDSDCCTNTPCAAPLICDAISGACIDCLTTADCSGTDVCASGFCVPCSDEGVDPGDASLCCAGLGYLDLDGDGTFVCTSACDPNASFYCNTLRDTVDNIVQGGETMIGYILGLIGSVALLLIIIAGIMYMTAAGVEEKITSAKRILSGAVIGLGIALLAFSLLQVIMSVLNM